MNVTSSVEHRGDYSHHRLSFYSSTDQSPENPPPNLGEVARSRKQQEPPRGNSKRDVNMLEEQNCKKLDYSSSREFGSLCGSLSCSRGSLPSSWSWSPGECRVVMGFFDKSAGYWVMSVKRSHAINNNKKKKSIYEAQNL